MTAGGARRADGVPVWVLALGLAVAVAAPFFAYPIFLMKLLCWALLCACVQLPKVGLSCAQYARLCVCALCCLTAIARSVAGCLPQRHCLAVL